MWRKFMGAGENIAWGQRSPEEVMNGWMNSSEHRANILNSSFKKIGVAYYVGVNGRTYWTQLFTY
nr:CAP domain-containing protein [Eubacterium sp. CAG:161]